MTMDRPAEKGALKAGVVAERQILGVIRWMSTREVVVKPVIAVSSRLEGKRKLSGGRVNGMRDPVQLVMCALPKLFLEVYDAE